MHVQVEQTTPSACCLGVTYRSIEGGQVIQQISFPTYSLEYRLLPSTHTRSHQYNYQRYYSPTHTPAMFSLNPPKGFHNRESYQHMLKKGEQGTISANQAFPLRLLPPSLSLHSFIHIYNWLLKSIHWRASMSSTQW